jgi:rhodanese-related sulfurtransferase
MTTTELHLDLTMAEVLARFPGARRALFQRFHIGGCQSCGYEARDTLGAVLGKHQIADTGAALETILAFDKMDRDMQIEPRDFVALRQSQPEVRLIDIRGEDEREIVTIEGAEPLSEELLQQLRVLPKDAPLVFHCRSGLRSLDAAAHFIGHGFTNVKSLAGGILAWAEQIDPSLRKY